MAPKKKSNSGYSVFMKETQQKLIKQGAKLSSADISGYCRKHWEDMPDEMKEEYKRKANKMKNNSKVGKYALLGENLIDVQKRLDNIKLQRNAMYSYIDKLFDMQPASHYLPKQKFILIHINSYTSESDLFYFPAEISMAEFSLEKGLIRMFHKSMGFDKVRTNAPLASAADIIKHAGCNHKIDVFSKFPKNYTEVLLKMIGFIMNKDVDESVLNNLPLDMPPVYTAHTTIDNELMITSSSLFKLFECTVRDAERDDFNNKIRVYHLDKLFMNLKNACYKVKHPNTDDLVLPDVDMATDYLSKFAIYTINTLGCNFHENMDRFDICSSYFVCKWINIISAHCCPYFDIELISGYHYDFDLSKIVSPVEENIDEINISKFSFDFFDDCQIDKPKTFLSNSDLPTIEGKLSTVIQKPVSHKPNTNSETLTNKEDNFPPLGNSKNAPVIAMNSWSRTVVRGRGIICQDSNQPFKGRGLVIRRNK